MLTKRSWIIFIIAVILYFLANQTQIGWIYLISASFLGLLLVSFFYSRGQLRGIQIKRSFEAISDSSKTDLNDDDDLDFVETLALPTFHEDDEVKVSLEFRNTNLWPIFLTSGHEQCPFAPMEAQQQPFFLPRLFRNQPITLSYQTYCDRRGLYNFSTLPLRSKGPFGFTSSRRAVSVASEVLIYPQYHPLKRLRILERRETGEREANKVGGGVQVIGTREYRRGDSLRQIHWRSTARRGDLVVKEFLDDDQYQISLVLDLSQQGGIGRGKYAPFESAIRIAASLGYYATQRDISFQLFGSNAQGRAPNGVLSWWAILNYLAKVQNNGRRPLSQVLTDVPSSSFLIVMVHQLTSEISQALTNLKHKHGHVLAIVLATDDATSDLMTRAQHSQLTIKYGTSEDWEALVKSL